MRSSLTVVAKVFSNTLTFFAAKHVSSFCKAKATHMLSAKISMYLPYFKIKILTSR